LGSDKVEDGECDGLLVGLLKPSHKPGKNSKSGRYADLGKNSTFGISSRFGKISKFGKKSKSKETPRMNKVS